MDMTMQRVFKVDDTKVVGDPHLGRSFINGVPLSRRGDREKMVRDAFIVALNPDGARFHVCMGDLFDKPNVPLETIWFAASEYNKAAQSHPDTQFIVLAGNHDLDRDQTRVSAFQIFNGLVWAANVTVVTSPTNHELGLLIPWSPLSNAEQLITEANLDGAKTAFGHWDLDGVSQNLIPIDALKELGVERVFNGHVHLPRTETRDGIKIINVGSLQAYAHGEGSEFYLTVSLEEARTQDFKDKCVRIRLQPGEVLDFEVDCLQLKVENPETEVDLSVDYDDAFDLKALAQRAGEEAGVPVDLWEKVMGRL
jgi:predicted phosphodiesterase